MIELKIPDMTSATSASAIRRAILGVDAGASCEIDLGAKSVRVSSALPPSDFVEALEEVGYQPILVRAVG